MDINYIAMIDVETTGIDPYADNHKLLEVAIIVTGFDLKPIGEPLELVIQYSEEEIVELKKKTNDYVLNMHTKTGLWDKLSTGVPLAEVDGLIVEYIKKHTSGEPKDSALGGNSIFLDRSFINKYLPQTGEHLHYRSIDVTSVSLLAQHWYDVQYKKNNTHNALDDIKESLNELTYLKDNIFRK